MAVDVLAETSRFVPSADFNDRFVADFYAPYEKAIFNALYRMTGSREQAEDLSMEVFLKAYQSVGNITGELKIKPWLYQIAKNLVYDQSRRNKVVKFFSSDNLFETVGGINHPFANFSRYDDPQQSAEISEQQDIVRAALDRLPPREKQVLSLREYEELSCEQIAEVMGTTRSAVKSLLFRARIALKKEIESPTRIPENRFPNSLQTPTRLNEKLEPSERPTNVERVCFENHAWDFDGSKSQDGPLRMAMKHVLLTKHRSGSHAIGGFSKGEVASELSLSFFEDSGLLLPIAVRFRGNLSEAMKFTFSKV